MTDSHVSGWRTSPPRLPAATYLPEVAGTSKEASAPGIALKKDHGSH